MSAAAKVLCPGSRSGPGLRDLAKRNSADTAPRFLSAPELMSPGTGVVLPQLAGIQPELQWVSDDRSLVTLAKRLLELGIAVPGDWPRCGKNPSKYLMATVRRWIERYGASQIRRRFDLHVTVSDTILAYPDRDAEDGKLFLVVDPESAGYVVLKPCFELLESVERQLPATLFRCLVSSLNHWLRVYDYRDAEDRVELLREWATADGNPEEYELPDLDGCTPKCVSERALSVCAIKRLEAETNNAVARGILPAMLRLHDVAKRSKHPKMTEEIREELSDCNPPLPCLLAAFSEHDAVEACFDEEAQSALEMEPQPNLIIPVNVKDSASVRSAFRALRGFCQTVAAASKLMDLLPGNETFVFQEEGNECSSEDRHQPHLPPEAGNSSV